MIKDMVLDLLSNEMESVMRDNLASNPNSKKPTAREIILRITIEAVQRDTEFGRALVDLWAAEAMEFLKGRIDNAIY